eukprot:355983-Chlamydomonas_euryale.AAC.4
MALFSAWCRYPRLYTPSMIAASDETYLRVVNRGLLTILRALSFPACDNRVRRPSLALSLGVC